MNNIIKKFNKVVDVNNFVGGYQYPSTEQRTCTEGYVYEFPFTFTYGNHTANLHTNVTFLDLLSDDTKIKLQTHLEKFADGIRYEMVNKSLPVQIFEKLKQINFVMISECEDYNEAFSKWEFNANRTNRSS